MELLGNNPSMQDLIEKLNEVVGSLNDSLPNTDSEIAEVKKLVSFGSDILAGRLNAKLWYFKTQEFMKASTELCEGDSCFILNPGSNTGEGTFEYWYIYKTADVGEILDSYIELANPDLVGVKIQELTFKALLSKFDSIKKFSFLDLVTTATETNPGKALDAIVGKLLADRIGNLEELSTVDKNSLVGAIKEVKTVVEDNYSENTKKINSKAERTELQTETSERKQEIAVERARINNLLKSTSDTVTSTCEVSDEYGGNASAEVSSDGINVQIKLTNFQFLKTWESSDGTEATASPEKILDLPNHSFAPFEERTVVYTDGTLTYYIENDSLYVTSSTDTISIFGDVTISYAIIDSLQSEVADIRVGADGKVYGTAGVAVRGQIGELKSDIVDLDEKIETTKDTFFDIVEETHESINLFNVNDKVVTANGVTVTVENNNIKCEGSWDLSFNLSFDTGLTITLESGSYDVSTWNGSGEFDIDFVGGGDTKRVNCGGATHTFVNITETTIYAIKIRCTPSFSAGSCDIMIVTGNSKPSAYERYFKPYRTIVDASVKKSVLPTFQKFYGKRIATIGDSIMHGDGNDSYGIGDILVERNGMILTDYSEGGATISYRTDKASASDEWSKGQNIQYQATKMLSEMTEKPCVVLIDGQTNDINYVNGSENPQQELGTISTSYTSFASKETFCGGLEKIFSDIKKTWTDVPIIYIRVHKMMSRKVDWQKDYGEKAIQICKKWSVKVVDIYDEGGLNTLISEHKIYTGNGGDYTHPNRVGYDTFYIPRIEYAMMEVIN